MRELLIACVGKPSAGKSTFLNAVTDANAKTGNYPFTTIEPNHGVAFYTTECPCKRFGKSDKCKPRYGKCVDGRRSVPVKVMDVAGLVPGAHEGKGLGNQFLDDLRHADVLLHVVDASGTTNEKGEATSGYDPISDVEWLRSEIHLWIFYNLQKKWTNIVRRHVATRSDPVATLQAQLSGYGTTEAVVARFYTRISGDLPPLHEWQAEHIHTAVDAFLEERFPTVIVLNKIDNGDADKNIQRILKKYGGDMIVLSSALAECFLKKLHKDRFIDYEEGADSFKTADENPELNKMDEKTRNRLTKISDLVLFRYDGTGCADAIKRAVEARGYLPAYPVKNINNFGGDGTQHVFRDCLLIPPGMTVREFAKLVHPELEKYYLYAEGVGGIRLGESDIVTDKNNIISFRTSQALNPSKTDK